MLDKDVTGLVFNVQKFSMHDGTGIRTIVFLKGCSLRCIWCCNPESQNPKPEMAYNPSRCLTVAICGRCVQACPHGAISVVDGMLFNDRSRCVNCLKCTEVCYTGARTAYGEIKSVGEILETVNKDQCFYARSHGGLTLSGGEALTQPVFALALLREARRHHINTALETCGCYPYQNLFEAAAYLNGLMFDIKCIDPARHKKVTGGGNDQILSNFQNVCRDYPNLPILARTPIIPGVNDSKKDIQAILDFLPKQPNVHYELLPYHPMGQVKYEYLGRRYLLDGVTLDKKKMAHLKDMATEYMAKVRHKFMA